MTKVTVYDQLPGTGKSTRMIDKINNSDKDRRFIVYEGSLDGVVVYVGMGSEDRHLHLNSGVSHLYDANKAHFKGKKILVQIVKAGLSKEAALQLERHLIEEKQPVWNSTYTEATRIKKLMTKVLSKYKEVENKSTNLHILILALGNIQQDCSFMLETKIFNSATGLNLAGWVANYRNAKGPHKFVEKVDKIKSGVYKLTLNKKFINKLDTYIQDLRLVNDRE